jgi:uncharacterized lipoprotein YddW (UPF0748 family)
MRRHRATILSTFMLAVVASCAPGETLHHAPQPQPQPQPESTHATGSDADAGLAPGTSPGSPALAAAEPASPPPTLTPPSPRGPTYTPVPPPLDLPSPAREFRGVWIAAVSNIDWPSRRTLTSEQQQAELVRMLDEAVRLNLNTVILQVRPAGDALYASQLEPWSEYLTGQQGRAPEPYYDPLAFAIEEAHRRGLELHAWFNPYRARHPSARSAAAANHITRRRPDVVRTYGTHVWMDPSEPEVRAHALAVILDVVRRYDVDGVHIDDYFYPYQERDRRNRLIPFPDDRNWERYRARGGTLSRDDWRRSHVDGFVRELYDAVKVEKRWVKVGISPFGIWRPGHPPSVRGLDAYRDLYADARKWLNEGWLDYMVPQLYWRIAAPEQPYTDLLSWWIAENRHARHMVAGNIPNRVGTGARDWPAHEIVDQVRLTRAHDGASGTVLFSMRTLVANRNGVSDALRGELYATPALVPASPWLGDVAPPPPALVVDPIPASRATLVAWQPPAERPSAWLVRVRFNGEWRVRVVPGGTQRLRVDWPGETPPDAIAVAAVSRTGVEGQARMMELR